MGPQVERSCDRATEKSQFSDKTIGARITTPQVVSCQFSGGCEDSRCNSCVFREVTVRRRVRILWWLGRGIVGNLLETWEMNCGEFTGDLGGELWGIYWWLGRWIVGNLLVTWEGNCGEFTGDSENILSHSNFRRNFKKCSDIFQICAFCSRVYSVSQY